jgi:hypothetical protein
MTTLYITEYAGTLAENTQVSHDPPLAEQTVANAGGATQSAAFNASTRLIRLHTDSICSVLIGTNPVATTSSGRMAANTTEYRGVVAGQNMRLSVILNT